MRPLSFPLKAKDVNRMHYLLFNELFDRIYIWISHTQAYTYENSYFGTHLGHQLKYPFISSMRDFHLHVLINGKNFALDSKTQLKVKQNARSVEAECESISETIVWH